MAKKHPEQHYTVILAGTFDTICAGCLKRQHTRNRLIRRLESNATCSRRATHWHFAQRAVEVAEFEPYKDPKGAELARAEEAPVERCQGPFVEEIDTYLPVLFEGYAYGKPDEEHRQLIEQTKRDRGLMRAEDGPKACIKPKPHKCSTAVPRLAAIVPVFVVLCFWAKKGARHPAQL